MSATAFETDLETLRGESEKTPYDAIVVGGGSAGLTAARTLFERGARVAVLEAGPAPFLTHMANTDTRFARGLSRSLRDATAYHPALAAGGSFGVSYGCLGGRGLFWNGAAPRFSALDFAEWPIAAGDLKEDYIWAEHEFRVGIALGRTPLAGRMLERLAGAGLKFEAGPFAADVPSPAPIRLSAGIASGLGLFLRACGDAVADGRLRLAVRTQAERLLIGEGAVRGVIATDGGTRTEILSRSVVLAGGCIESIKLAQLSGVADPHGRIGKGLQEHLFYHCFGRCRALYDANEPDSAVVYRRAADQSGQQWEIHLPGNRLFAVDDGTAWKPDDGPAYQLMMRSFAATEKRDENFVEARDGPLGSSVVHFAHSPRDEAVKARIAAEARSIGAALEIAPADAPPIDSIDRFRPPGNSYHEAGGLDMGADPGSSVTDPFGRFHTVGNLVVADAAAFPRIGATNPHLTIVATARRTAGALADALART